MSTSLLEHRTGAQVQRQRGVEMIVRRLAVGGLQVVGLTGQDAHRHRIVIAGAIASSQTQ